MQGSKLFVPLLATLLGGAVAAGQESPPPTPYGETLDVRVVNVEVVVTDRAGRRVEGLSADDFRLLVDGEEVAVDYFSEVRDGRIASASEGAEAAAPAALDEAVPTQLLVFVDDAFSIARDRDRVLARLAADLDRLAPGDRVAVVAFDGRRVEPLLDWTGDRAAIAAALAAAAERPARGLRPLVRGQGLGGVPTFGRTARALGDLELDAELDRLVSAGVAAMRAAGRPDGRRAVLLLSGGWPFFPFGAFASGGQPDLATLRVRGDEMFAPLVDAANLLGYTLYPVDVPGLLPDQTISAEHARPRRASVLDDREQQSHHTLYHLASETGGRAMINGLRSEALPRLAADVTSYYWLGFSPERRGDDRRHAIRVEVRGRGGLDVRARDSYFDLSREAAQTMTLEGTLLFARGSLGGVALGGTAAEGGLEIVLGAAAPRGRRVAEVPVRVSFPVDALEAVPFDGGWRVSGELRVAALDESSRLSRVPVVPITLDLAEPPEPGERLTWEGTLALRRVDQVVAVSLADPLSGRVLTSRLEATP